MKKTIFAFCLVIVQLFALSAMAAPEGRLIKGVVLDETGEALIGATVQVEGTSIGVSTDIDGNFQLKAADGQTILVSYIGYKSQTIKVGPSTNDLRITLEINSAVLEDVVVVGYGTMRKKDLTGAVTQINPDKIADQNPGSVQDLLRGTPGLQIGYDASAKGQSASIKLRGENSLGTNVSPMIVLGRGSGPSLSLSVFGFQTSQTGQRSINLNHSSHIMHCALCIMHYALRIC